MSLINRRKLNKINKAKQQSYNTHQQCPYIGEYNEAPSYTLDNKYLLTGYRINYNTLGLALKSMFHKHNETCNIWSHLLPLFLFLGLFIYSQIQQIAPFISFMKESENHYSDIQLWPLQYCLLCAIILFTISTTYHTFFCVNKTLSCVLLRLDYGGICLVASGGVIPVIQYGFYCNQQIKDIYTFMIILLCILTFISSLFDYMHKEQFVVYKTLIYVMFFTFIFTPVFHLMMFSRYNLLGGHFHFNDTENYFLVMLIFLISGITTYATRFPERCYPRRFDIFINSHTIWHIFVVLSYSTTYIMSLNMYTIRENYKCT
ncbi:unnamed protein product [Paramecium pentaurelia]|uniref:Uncharacterized protein n=1 Tax=Paramecium pentaurelia TaxID=43138 RepID=A0A8S1SA58_9CILI|nr:unnamed protein product [Paramecium pentaurelia]